MAKPSPVLQGQQENHRTVIDLEPFESALADMGVGVADDDGATVPELKKALGINTLKVQALLTEAHQQGRLIKGTRYDNNHYSGKRIPFNVYRLKEK